MSNCHFCEIAQGVVPKELVYQNQYVIAFAPSAPIAEGHLIVIPKHHIPSFFEMTYRDLLDVASAIDDLKKVFRAGPGLTIVTTNRSNTNPDVPADYSDHFQLHMIPTIDESIVGPWGK